MLPTVLPPALLPRPTTGRGKRTSSSRERAALGWPRRSPRALKPTPARRGEARSVKNILSTMSRTARRSRPPTMAALLLRLTPKQVRCFPTILTPRLAPAGSAQQCARVTIMLAMGTLIKAAHPAAKNCFTTARTHRGRSARRLQSPPARRHPKRCGAALGLARPFHLPAGAMYRSELLSSSSASFSSLGLMYASLLGTMRRRMRTARYARLREPTGVAFWAQPFQASAAWLADSTSVRRSRPSTKRRSEMGRVT